MVSHDLPPSVIKLKVKDITKPAIDQGPIWGQALHYCIFDLETNRIFDKNAIKQA
jgi:hypothetical protein